MPLPITPNEDARIACIGELRQIGDRLMRADTTVADVDAAKEQMVRRVGHMLSRMDMDDVCHEIDRIMKWGED